MNIYRGCSHGCIYCDSRSDCYGVNGFDEIAVKENALEIIEKELRSKIKKGIIGTGAMSDPYNPLEAQYNLTENALKLIHRYGFGVNITTKSDLVTRDIGLLKQISTHSPAGVGITITSANDDLSVKIEPSAPPSSRRFAAIKRLAENNIYAGILMMPVLPFISDSPENILSIVSLASENGAKFIFPGFGMTLRAGQREYYYQSLDILYPGLKERYMQTFGASYECVLPWYSKLKKLFSEECHRKGIVYSMDQIISGIHSISQVKQMTFF